MQTRDEQIQALRDLITKMEDELFTTADLIIALDQQANKGPDEPLPKELSAEALRLLFRTCLAYTATRLRFRSVTGERP